MSDQPTSRTHVWMIGISASMIVVMAALLFAQMRYIAEQNHDLMIENQKLGIQIDLLQASLTNEGNRVVARLDAGLPLATANSSPLNIEESLEGPIIGALVRQVKDDRPYVQLYGLRGLLRVRPDGSRREIFAPMIVPAVIPMLRDERFRAFAVAVLNDYRPYAAAAAPTILETCDAVHWSNVQACIQNTRTMDPQCDYVPLLIRHVQQSSDTWKTTLKQMQHSFTDEEVLQAYEGALDQASDENVRRRYAGIVRYLKDRPPAGSLQPPRTVDEYIKEEGATKSE